MSKNRLEEMCRKLLIEKELGEEYRARLDYELKEIEVQEGWNYFLDLYDKKLTFTENENNLLIPYLLGLCPPCDITQEAAYTRGEFPDVDMDYLPDVRDHLKNEWAVKEYGREYVCSIGTYGTLGIKAAMLDMARIHGVLKDEVQMVTKQVEDKDDEGEAMEWDKAIELYADFKNFCDRHPDVATAAKMMLDRNKSGGVHAGGLIISSKPIHNFVPLEVRSVKKDQKHGVLVSAWCEGQATQDLQPVGLVKFDLLVVDGLMQIAQACELIRKRHGIERINALPGGRNWSDTAYLHDPKALAMADKADLKCVFQFGSDGIRTMVKRGGVNSFDDLMAYSALYRPGPLNCFYVHTNIRTKTGNKTVKELKNWYDEIAYVNKEGKITYTKRFIIWKTGKKKMVKITTKSGKSIMVSLDHPILAEGGKFKKAKSLKIGEKIAIDKL